MSDASSPLCPQCHFAVSGPFCGHCGAPTLIVQTVTWQSRFLGGGSPWAVDQAYLEVTKLGTLLTEPFRHLDQIPRKTRRAIIVLALVGAVPLAASVLTKTTAIQYWMLAIYFSILWAGFFAVLYHTEGADPKIAAAMYFGTGIFSIGLLLVMLAYGLEDLRTPFLQLGNPLIRLLGFIGGVGVPEELVKALPLLILTRVLPLPPLRLFIYYGLIAGLGFGFYEGISYQTDANLHSALSNVRAASTDDAKALAFAQYYLENVLRLTSAPFFHAVWTAIAAFSIWFATRFPTHRVAFYALAIAIPAVFHGCYDGFLSLGQPALTILAALLSAGLLGVFVGSADRIQRNLELDAGERPEHRPGSPGVSA